MLLMDEDLQALSKRRSTLRLSLRRRIMARPRRPLPRRASVEGSGTGETVVVNVISAQLTFWPWSIVTNESNFLTHDLAMDASRNRLKRQYLASSDYDVV